MAAAAVTYNDFVGGTTIVSSQVDQNFADILAVLNGNGAGALVAASIAAGQIPASKLGLQAMVGMTTNSVSGATGQAILSGAGTKLMETQTGTLTGTAASSRITAVTTQWALIIGAVRYSGLAGGSAPYTLLAETCVNGSQLSTTGSATQIVLPFAGTAFGLANATWVGEVALVKLTSSDYVQFGYNAAGTTSITNVGAFATFCVVGLGTTV